jgi:hypothetical protein
MRDLGIFMNRLALNRLRRLVTPWGGRLQLLCPERFEDLASVRGYSWAPFTSTGLGVHYNSLTVVMQTPVRDHRVAEVIHEMGHVFASKKKPDDSNEFDFFGWEMATARAIGLPWEHWRDGTRDYQLWDAPRREEKWPSEVGGLTESTYELLLQDRLARARELGLVDATDAPLCIR